MSVPADRVGVIHRRDAVGAGLTDSEITRLVRSGIWKRIRRGAYIDATIHAQMDAVERHRALVHAVVAHLDTPAVVSHVSALVLLGLPVWGHDLRHVHVSRADLHSARTEAG